MSNNIKLIKKCVTMIGFIVYHFLAKNNGAVIISLYE